MVGKKSSNNGTVSDLRVPEVFKPLVKAGSIKKSISKDLPVAVGADEETAGVIDLSGVKLNSLGPKKDTVTLTISASSGTLEALPGSGVTVDGNGSGTISLTGSLKALSKYFENASALSYTGAKDVFGTSAASLSFSVVTPRKSYFLGEVAMDIADVSDDLIGTPEDDTLTGEAGRNVIQGLAGNDSLEGLGGDDVISGSSGDDTISGGTGADTLDGGEGDDVLYYRSSAGGVTVGLEVDGNGKQNAFGGDAEGDVISGFEHVYASEFADTVTGNAGKNILFGYGGNDVLSGEGGDDVIQGGEGADTMAGGEGSDWVRYLGSSSGVQVSLQPGSIGAGGDAEGDELSGFENIQGSLHSDILVGDAGGNYFLGFAGDDTIDGGDGNDTVRGGSGADSMSGGSGIDTLQYIRSAAGVAIDLNADIDGKQSASGGDAQGDVISGFENVFGSDFGDVLTGDGGRNYLYGYGGNDVIAGGGGNDVLRGFEGEDSFVFDTELAASNVDRILDFEVGSDMLVLDSAVFEGLDAGSLDPRAFLSGAAPVASSADQRILYDTETGRIYFDSDGSGVELAVAFAQLTTRPDLDADCFSIL